MTGRSPLPQNQPKGRQLREQGYTDGHAGREPRWPREPVYMTSYRRGLEARGQEG